MDVDQAGEKASLGSGGGKDSVGSNGVFELPRSQTRVLLEVTLECAEISEADIQSNLGNRVIAGTHHLFGARYPNTGQLILEADSRLVMEELGEVPRLHGGNLGSELKRDGVRIMGLDKALEAPEPGVIGEGALGWLPIKGHL